MHVGLTDAGGGTGSWSVSTPLQHHYPGVTVVVSNSVSVPGGLTVTANVSHAAPNGDVTGFVVLTHDGQTRRIPFWVEVNHPLLRHRAREARSRHPGIYRATTVGGASKVIRYRYPTKGDGSYPGPEVAYLVHVTKPIANFGVAVLSGTAIPHVVFAGDENHLTGFTGLPTDLNPYLETFGEARPVAGVDPARARELRDRLRHALREPGGAVHVPLLGQRHDAAEAARPLDERQEDRRRDHRRRGRGRSRTRCGRRSTAAASSSTTATTG